jgi:hypothetical protein
LGAWLFSIDLPASQLALPAGRKGIRRDYRTLQRIPHTLYWPLELVVTMEKGLPSFVAAAVLAILTLSSLVAAPASAVQFANPYAPPVEPVWATLNSAAQGNYPGGNELFVVFVVNSDQPPAGNVTILNMTLTAPALPAGHQSNTGIGLPATLPPGGSLLSTIHLAIPSDFSENNFTANLVVNVLLWNGTVNLPLQLTGSTQVFMLSLPGQSNGATTTTTTTVIGTTATQTGTVSTTLFAVGVAIPSIVAVLLLILLARGRPAPK